MQKARREHLDRWWQFWNRRDALSNEFKKRKRVICCSRVTRRPIVVFLSTEFCPSDLIQVFTLNDDYSFGVLQSDLHFRWFRTSSRLKVETDLRYSERTVFNTFPWPQSPTAEQIDAVAEAGREVRRIRADVLKKIKGGLRAVYRTLELPGKNSLKDAHAALDAAVLDAYGFNVRAASVSERSQPLPYGRGSDRGCGSNCEADLLKQLLDLNLEVAGRIERGEPVTAPGVPLSYGDPAALVTDDCIRPPTL